MQRYTRCNTSRHGLRNIQQQLLLPSTRSTYTITSLCALGAPLSRDLQDICRCTSLADAAGHQNKKIHQAPVWLEDLQTIFPEHGLPQWRTRGGALHPSSHSEKIFTSTWSASRSLGTALGPSRKHSHSIWVALISFREAQGPLKKDIKGN